VTIEKARRSHTEKLRRKADMEDAKGRVDRARDLRDKAARSDPDRLPEHEIQRRVDERVAATEDVRRIHRSKIAGEARDVLKPVKKQGAAVSLVAQRITRAATEDLRAYKTELEAEFDALPNHQRHANKELRRQIDKALKGGDLKRVEEAAEGYRKLVAPAEKKLTEQGLLAEGQATKAKLIPYAVRNMGARHEKAHWRDEDGRRLSESEVRAIREKQGDETVRKMLVRVPARTVVPKKVIRRTAIKPESPALPPRKEFIESRARADDADTPTVEKLTSNLKPGKPGLAIEPEFVTKRFRDGESAGFGREMSGTKVIVERDAHGKAIGAARITLDEHGRPDIIEVAVDEAHRGKGVASRLLLHAHEHGYDIEKGVSNSAFTEGGAALHHGLLKKKPQGATRFARSESVETRPLSARAIRAHMRREGVKEPAFITQAPGRRGAGNFFISGHKPQKISGKRTGEATRKGTFDADPETLVEGAARSQGLVDATEGFRGFVDEFAQRGKTGGVRTFQSHKQAVNAAREKMFDADGEPIPGARELRAIRVNPLGASPEQLQRLLEDVDSLSQAEHATLKKSLTDALDGTDGAGPWVLVPEAAAARLQEHVSILGPSHGKKALQAANSAFRKTVLSTSLPWLTGNVAEATLRAGLAKAGPASYVRGRKALRKLGEIDAKAAEEAAVRIVGGGHYSLADRGHVHRGADQFEGARLLGPVAAGLSKVWQTPGPKHVATAWRAWTDFVFHSVNRSFESKVQTAMLGRALKDAGYKAADDAARGLRGTNAQVRFGREVDRMYGRYGKFSPTMRQGLVLYTPFVAWALNAAYFVSRTLPSDHPVATAVIASAEQAAEEWRKEHGLDLFMEGAVPGFLQGSVPISGGRKLRVAKYTPFGAFGAFSETVGGQVLPAWKGVIAALNGKDWKGKELRVGDRPANELERWVFAAKALAEAHVPVVGQAQRVAKDGPAALNPFRPVAPKEKKAAGTKKLKWQDSGSSVKWTDKKTSVKWLD
jgi:GNAT superfamily N-acetyltransferase